ncbi:MAG: phenylalanine--tRNA ligase subunit beta [Bacteroidetes bacterium]|nr:MAG: phenylalanine--tRNA ligase subunit beta [Bacteroidota bacterium]
MKISYNWLKQYINTDLSVNEIAQILTETGLEVESVEKIEAVKGGLQGVIVGEVLTCEKHPDADRLKVTTVNIGGEIVQVVCGAPNVAAGQKVPLATVGCTLYPSPEEPLKIKASKIRGVESQGMLCAEDELGIGHSHDGILVLDPSLKPGISMAEVLELEDDYMIEIGLTPNRADAMGHIGVARDLKAYLNVHNAAELSLQLPDIRSKFDNTAEPVKVKVLDTEKCPRYMGVVINNVSVKPSPAWLQKRLRAVGLSPINNIVDVTNYVMRELGTPLHAFDQRTLNGHVVVRCANEGEKMITLDEVVRELNVEDLMIANESDSMCIAGVFGGLNSGVKDDTTAVFIESAYFDAVSVRKTAKRHGLNTDASFRFERGVDPELTEYALKRAVDLILETAGGEVGSRVYDVDNRKRETKKIDFSISNCNDLIGTEIEKSVILSILKELDIDVIQDKGDILTLTLPDYRVDVTREADVIEEVLRIFGFNNVPIPEKLNSSIGTFSKPDTEKVQQVLSEMLVGKGFSEIMNNSLTTSSYLEKLGGEVLSSDQAVPILNPLSQEQDIMRRTLLFNVLEVVEHNQNRQNPDLKIFEFGKVYHKYASGYTENRRLIIALTGRKQVESWNKPNDSVSYYDLKGIVNSVAKRLGLDSFLKESPLKKTLFEDGVQLQVLKSKVGEMGWVPKKVLKHFGIKQDVFIADLDWDVIVDSLKLVKVKYTELPKTFAVRRDFSLLLDKKVNFSEISEVAQESDKQFLKEVGLFDVYEGKNLDEGKKSYAVSFVFQDPEQTLKDEMIDKIMEKIRTNLESKLNAQLR